jgi:hypothetical protein
MKRIVVFLMGLSLVACSQSQTKDQFSSLNQQTAFSASEAAPTAPSTASAAQAGSGGGGSPMAADATQKNGSQAPATAAATSAQRSSSDNTNRSLTWLFGTVGVLVGAVFAVDAVTGGQAVGLFGEKRYPEDKERPSSPAPTTPPQAQAPSSPASSETIVPTQPTHSSPAEDCALPPSGNAEASSTIQSAQDVVKFAESPKAPE